MPGPGRVLMSHTAGFGRRFFVSVTRTETRFIGIDAFGTSNCAG